MGFKITQMNRGIITLRRLGKTISNDDWPEAKRIPSVCAELLPFVVIEVEQEHEGSIVGFLLFACCMGVGAVTPLQCFVHNASLPQGLWRRALQPSSDIASSKKSRS